MSEYYEDKHRYDDFLDLPHHQSTEREHMSLHDRAAQFSPFAMRRLKKRRDLPMRRSPWMRLR